MENATTKGHSAAQGGLRGHSIGDTFPDTVIGVGDGFAKYNLLTGETGPVRKTYDEALFWKELDQPCPTACPRTKRATACAVCDWFTAKNARHVQAAKTGTDTFIAAARDIGTIRLGLLKSA